MGKYISGQLLLTSPEHLESKSTAIHHCKLSTLVPKGVDPEGSREEEGRLGKQSAEIAELGPIAQEDFGCRAVKCRGY